MSRELIIPALSLALRAAIVGAIVALAGCALSHGREPSGDDGPTVPVGPDPDAGRAALDSGWDRPDAPPVPRVCDGPLEGLRAVEAPIPGPWGRSIARLREGDRTWLAAASVVDGHAHVLHFEDGPSGPEIVDDMVLPGPGDPVAAGMLGERLAVALVIPGHAVQVVLIDREADTVEVAPLLLPAGRVSLALTRERVGVAVPGATGEPSVVELLDARSGESIRSEIFMALSDLTIGIGRSGFAVLRTPLDGPTWVGDFRDEGLGPEEPIEARLLATSWDGASAVGADDLALAVRRPGGRIDRVDPGELVAAPSLAMHAGRTFVAAPGLDGNVVFALDGEVVSRPVEGMDVVYRVAAHASARHLGAFVLADGDDLRWVGYTCD